jgi:DICT domain-containing protein
MLTMRAASDALPPMTGGVIMSSRDTEYFRQRAVRERALAQSSAQANVAAIHEELARQYEALVHQAELRPTLRIVEPVRLSA